MTAEHAEFVNLYGDFPAGTGGAAHERPSPPPIDHTIFDS